VTQSRHAPSAASGGCGALAHQEHLRGLVISSMMSSVPAYNAYAEQVLMPAMDQGALAEIKAFEAAGDTGNPRYMELLMEQHYVHHVLRMPPADWPDPVQRAFAHIMSRSGCASRSWTACRPARSVIRFSLRAHWPPAARRPWAVASTAWPT
jgi:hypothetical protein